MSILGARLDVAGKPLTDLVHQRKRRFNLGGRENWRHLAALVLPFVASYKERVHRQQWIEVLLQVHIVSLEALEVVHQHAFGQLQTTNENCRIAEFVKAHIGGAGEIPETMYRLTNTTNDVDCLIIMGKWLSTYW